MLASTVMADDLTVEMDGTGDFDSIQAAVDAASDGDVIHVGPGIWKSDSAPGIPVVDVFEKSVSLQSVAGHELTFIDGEGERPCLFILNEDTKQTAMTVDGFTFINGVSDSNWKIIKDRTRGYSIQPFHTNIINHKCRNRVCVCHN